MLEVWRRKRHHWPDVTKNKCNQFIKPSTGQWNRNRVGETDCSWLARRPCRRSRRCRRRVWRDRHTWVRRSAILWGTGICYRGSRPACSSSRPSCQRSPSSRHSATCSGCTARYRTGTDWRCTPGNLTKPNRIRFNTFECDFGTIGIPNTVLLYRSSTLYLPSFQNDSHVSPLIVSLIFFSIL